MIDKDAIAEACRYADALAEEHGFDTFMEREGIDANDLIYVAEQRGLRALLIRAGRNPNMTQREPIRLSVEEQRLLPHFTSTWMDAFMAGVAATRREAADQ